VTPDFRNGQMQQFNFRHSGTGTDMVATVGYVGSAGASCTGRAILISPTLTPAPWIRAVLMPPNWRGVTGITWLESSGNSFLSSLQTTFEKRFSRSFYFLGNTDLVTRARQRRRRRGANGPVPQDPKNRARRTGRVQTAMCATA